MTEKETQKKLETKIEALFAGKLNWFRQFVRPTWQNLARRLILAFLAIAFITLIQLLVIPRPDDTPYLFFPAVILLVSLFMGLVPGLFALVLAALTTHLFFFLPHGVFKTEYEIDVPTFLFALSSLPIVLFSSWFRHIYFNLRETTAKLRAEGKRLKSAQEMARLGEWELDLEKNIIKLSDESYRIFGLKPRKLKIAYEDFLKIVHPDDRARVNAAFMNSLSDDKTGHEIEYRIVRPGGEIRHLYQKSRIIRNKEGKNIRSVTMILDITDRKKDEEKLVQSEEHYRTLTETSPDCIKLFSTKGELLYINKAGLLKHGLKSEKEAEKWDYLSSMDLKSGKRFKKAFKKALEGEAATVEISHVPKGSLRETCLEVIVPVKNSKGEVKTVYGVSRDISELKKIDVAKTEFVSAASHQLRTPLASMGLSAEMLLRNSLRENVSVEQKKYLKSIFRDVKEMSGLIDTLLNISRIEMGTFITKISPKNLQKELGHIFNEMLPLVEKRGIKFKKDCDKTIPPKINLDSNILKNVIRNLVSNSIKYTPKGGTITIKTRKKDKKIIISVIDTGAGIPDSIKPQLFTKMFRAYDMLEEKRTGKMGSGMGLYIVKSLLNQCRGEISVESSKEKGTAFHISFPLEGMKRE